MRTTTHETCPHDDFVDLHALKIQINNIRNRSQSDISDKRPGRYNRKFYNREYQKNQVSKDEIDVANTLLNFNNIHINYKEATR